MSQHKTENVRASRAERHTHSQFIGSLRRRIERGYFQSVIDPATAARFLLEAVAFFARHRYGDPDLQPGDDDVVRETVVQLLVRSFTGEQNQPRPSAKKGRKASEKKNR
jgi:hypothetical protein